jgi:hypothetical protein
VKYNDGDCDITIYDYTNYEGVDGSPTYIPVHDVHNGKLARFNLILVTYVKGNVNFVGACWWRMFTYYLLQRQYFTRIILGVTIFDTL